MAKLIVAVWIYVCGVFGAMITGCVLSQVLSAYPANHIETYGPVVPAFARIMATGLLPDAPIVLWCSATLSVVAGVYLWRSRRPLETRLFAVAVIAAGNLFLAMHFATMLVLVYFYLPKVANGV